VDAKSDSFLKPLVQKTIMIKKILQMHHDRHVKLNPKQVINSFIPDPWVHRQLYDVS
jgi:hypothetical protein